MTAADIARCAWAIYISTEMRDEALSIAAHRGGKATAYDVLGEWALAGWTAHKKAEQVAHRRTKRVKA